MSNEAQSTEIEDLKKLLEEKDGYLLVVFSILEGTSDIEKAKKLCLEGLDKTRNEVK